MTELVEVGTPEGPRPRPRWRLAVAVAVVASLGSGAVGYWLGEQGDGEDAAAEVVAGDGGRGGTEEVTAEAGGRDHAVVGAPAPAEGASAGASRAMVPADGGGASTVTPVLARTARDGTIIRVLESRWPAEMATPPPGGGWVPPAVCQPVGNLEIGLTTDVYTTSGWSEIFSEADGAAALWGGGWSGHPQLGPVLFAAVRVNGDVASVQLVHDGAVVDEAEPTGGWVVLAAQRPATERAAAGDFGPAGEIVAFDAGGRELARRPADQPDAPYTRAECQPPPPSLPDSVRPAGDGDEESVDAIRAAFDGAFGRGVDGEPQARPYVQSGEKLDDEFFADLRTRTAELGISEVHADVREVGFIDEQTAVVVFKLDGAPLGWMLGEALLVDGTWKVSSQTWCALVEMAVGTCPSGMRDPTRGPSRFDVYVDEG